MVCIFLKFHHQARLVRNSKIPSLQFCQINWRKVWESWNNTNIIIIVSGFMSPKLQDISREHSWLFYINIPAALNTSWQSGNDETWIYDCTLPSCNFLFLIIIINYCNLFGFIQKPTSWVGLVPNKLNSTLPWSNVGKW